MSGGVLEVFLIDANGIARGKWLPEERTDAVLAGTMPMPLSAYGLDVWGSDVPGAGLAVDAGDPDGLARAVAWTHAPVPWLMRPTRQLLVSLAEPDGTPFFADPRQVLTRVLDRFRARGLTPIVATEIEFYLIDAARGAHGNPRPPAGREDGWCGWQTQTLSVDALQAHEAVLADIHAACLAQDLPADTTLRENGPAQYEVNLRHRANALRAADETVLLKRIVRGVARRRGMDATFMAVPYGLYAGSGLHAHVSLRDGQDRAVFDTPDLLPLRHAVGGLLATMTDCMLIFAPHANSARRMRPDALAPSRAAWGVDNRTAAVRVIRAGAATRIEHRVAGADANPYLVLAAILAGIETGMAGRIDPGEPERGGVNARADRRLPRAWDDAMTLFEQSAFAAEAFGQRFRALFAAIKRQEWAEFLNRVSDIEYQSYLTVV